VHTAEVVIVRHGGMTVVTVGADYQGPLTPFAFVLPVPSDVTANRLRTVKRASLSRLEEVSAPRFHAFYEQNPCENGPPAQRWDEKVRAEGRGFLTPAWVPPLDQRYAVSNEIAIPMEPVFKGSENEFSYRVLDAAGVPLVREALAELGYVIGDEALAALSPYLGPGRRLLLAEVKLEHVELGGKDRVELGGIRYFSREAPAALPSTLGLRHSNGVQDLFVYVLDRKQRFTTGNYEQRFLPSNVEIEPRASETLGSVHDALFDAAQARAPEAFFAEFAWSTRGCGEPCPDAPLTPEELLTLGGDVLETHTTTEKERNPEPIDASSEERRAFAEQIALRSPAEQARARSEHARDLREIARRRALMARQTYVLTRLHHRYARAALPRDVELVPAPSAVESGVGVPKGPAHELSRTATPARDDAVQVRFTAFFPWTREMPCGQTFRYRWGKRWASEARADQSVPLAIDLARQPRTLEHLTLALRAPLPELGLLPLVRDRAAPASSMPVASTKAGVGASKRDASCAVGQAREGTAALDLALLTAFLILARARRRSFLERRGPVT